MKEDERIDYTKETWPAKAKYPHGMKTKDGFTLEGVYETVNGFTFTTNARGVELHEDEVVPEDSPRVLNVISKVGENSF